MQSSLPQSTDVFVVGGGPAGLAAGIAARRRGMEVVVADAATGPIDKACGEGIMPDGIAAARALGILLDSSLGQPFRGIRFAGSSGSTQAEFPLDRGLGIRRTVLHARLLEHARDFGVRLAYGTRVDGFDGHTVHAGERSVSARWIVGADGGQSRVRCWSGLNDAHRESIRYGFRRHYRVEDAGEFMELHWGDGCQLYLTPVAPSEICLVVISGNPHLRLDDALPRFPLVQAKLAGREIVSAERGGVSVTRRLNRVCGTHVALIGDASGSVDAITGDGLYLLFEQARALADALEHDDLKRYQRAHRRIGRRPECMSALMLLLDRHPELRRRALGAMFTDSSLFARMLAMHVGQMQVLRYIPAGIALGWQILMVAS
jgi:flavin-dependent dehydrogenase